MISRRRSFSHTDDVDAGGVNLTPLIDVVFVVLILFILVAPMLNIDKIELATGAPKENQTFNENEGIRIEVFANNEIQINKQLIGADQLEAVLGSLKRSTNEAPKLFCDRRASFGTFQQIKTALEKSGYEELDIVLGS
jgi:biopolymer transport protein ExbD